MDKDGTITLNIFELLCDLSPEVLERLSRELACQEVIFESVAEQIIGGIDSAGYASSSMGVSHAPATPLDAARRYVAKNALEGAHCEISRLENKVKQQEETISGLRKTIRMMRDLGAEDAFWSAYHVTMAT